MTTLSEVKAGKRGKVLSVDGRADFQRRITAVGVTPGSSFSVVQNERKYPMLLDIRSTLLAVDRGDCAKIMVEVTGDE
ncbi:MAG: ferrous iron transport protein A [Bacteroidales bacterium]|nr:ferrous iron transport protein A [Bacteroidales bacterium]MCM1417064.1 ferrous iron transport protein A [bacterium]MCM1424956.1 ferrous iron transport protein A [bacterium]